MKSGLNTGRSLQWSRFPKEAEGVTELCTIREWLKLQWSRFPKEAEGVKAAAILPAALAASMEPLPEGSGRAITFSASSLISEQASMEPLPEGSGRIRRARTNQTGFLRLQWSRFPKEAEGLTSRVGHPRPRASMEPLPEGSGRTQRTDLSDPSPAPLQWSRFPKEAEGSSLPSSASRKMDASMEPLPEGSGRAAKGSQPDDQPHASMEPLPEGSGRKPNPDNSNSP